MTKLLLFLLAAFFISIALADEKETFDLIKNVIGNATINSHTSPTEVLNQLVQAVPYQNGMQKKNAQEKLGYYLYLKKSNLQGTETEKDLECFKILKRIAEDLRSDITTEDNDLHKILLKLNAKLNERQTMIEILTKISDKNLLAAGVLNTFTNSLKDLDKELKNNIGKTSDANTKSKTESSSPPQENKSKDAEKQENEKSSGPPEERKGSDPILQGSSKQTQNPQKTTERISRDKVLLKISESRKLYEETEKELELQELEEESNKVHTSLSELYKAIKAVNSKLLVKANETIIMDHVIDCAKTKGISYERSSRALEDCKNKSPRSADYLKKYLQHIYNTLTENINSALLEASSCETNCDDKRDLKYSEILNDIILNANKEIANIKNESLLLRSNLQLCIENEKLERSSLVTRNEPDIVDCALWSIRKKRPICRLSLTNCEFSRHVIETFCKIFPWKC